MVPTDHVRGEQRQAIAEGAAHLGDVVLYDAESITIARSALKAAFDAEDLGACVVDEMTPAGALARAQQRQLPKTLMVKAFARVADNARQHPIGVYVRREGALAEGGDNWVCGARVRVDIDLKRPVALAPEGGTIIAECMEIAEAVRNHACRLLDYAETTDVTQAAVAALTGPLRGVSMRKRGGVYFVRPTDGARWQRLADKLAPYGFTDLSYPIAGSARAIRATAHHTSSALEGDLRDLTEALKSFDPEKTRDKTVHKRMADLDELLAKGSLYEDILGAKLAEIQGSARDLKDRMRRYLMGDASAQSFPSADGAPAEADPFAFGSGKVQAA